MPQAGDGGATPASYGAVRLLRGDSDWLGTKKSISRKSSGDPGPTGVGILGRLFASAKNVSFVKDMELAARVALFVLLLGIPLIRPEGSVPLLSRLVKWHLITPATLQYVFFTISKSTGETLCQWCNTLVGCSVAIVAILCLHVPFPGGSRQHGPTAEWAAMILGVTFTVGVPWLNLPITTVIFACSRFVVWWMEFMNPEITDFQVWSKCRNELLACLMGGLAAMAATVVPGPRLAIWESAELAERLSRMLNETWVDFAEYFCGTEKMEMQANRIDADLRRVAGELKRLESAIHSAWWECRLFPEHNKARLMLYRQFELVQHCYGRLLDVQYICNREGFETTHDELMGGPVKEGILRLTHTACKLLRRCMQFSCDGKLAEDEIEELRRMMHEIRVQEKELADVYHATKRAVLSRSTEESDRRLRGRRADLALSKLLMDEDAFCFEVCAFARQVHGDAGDLLEDAEGRGALREPEFKGESLTRPFDTKVMASDEQAAFALKTGMAILLGFLLGYVSEGTLLQRYDVSVAFLVALLLKKGGGSAVTRGMARLQGMVVGFVSGSLVATLVFNVLKLYGLVGELIMMLCLLLGVYGAMFLYLHSTTSNNQYIGQLIAIVGVPPLVTRMHPNSEFNYQTSQFQTNAIVIVLFVMGLVGTVFSARVSLQAFVALEDTWFQLGKLQQEVFDPALAATTITHYEILELVQHAKFLGVEASEEPRFWRLPWKNTLFAFVCSKIERVRGSIRSVQAATSVGHREGGERTPLFQRIIRLPSFQRLVTVAERKHQQMLQLLQVFDDDALDEQKALFSAENTETFMFEWESAMTQFIDDVNFGTLLQAEDPAGAAASSLEDDSACVVSRLVLNMGSVLWEMKKMQNEILQKSEQEEV